MAKNKRCPLQEECERKCTYQGHELDCDYYHINARKDYYIDNQEEIRREIEKKDMEEYWARRLAEEDDDEEEYIQDEYEDKPKPEVTYLDGPMGVTEKIKKAMYETAKQFVYIGFLLWEVQEYGYYSEKGYADVYEYAETELGFKRSSTKNFIAINIKFGSREVKDGWNMIQQRTMFLQPKYEKFSYSQLCEMLSMSAAKRETVTPDMTIKQIREIKKQPEPDLPPEMETIPIPMPEDKTPGQTSGQEEKLKATSLNNIWKDIPEEVIKTLVKAAGLRYNPNSHWDITIQRHFNGY